MKGQTAIEYLMTYGWAILIILIVAGVLAYYGIFAPSSFLGPTARGFGQIQVLNPWALGADGTITLNLANRVGGEVIVRYVNVTIGAQSDLTCLDDVTIASGAEGIFTCDIGAITGTPAAGDTYSAVVVIHYSYPSTEATAAFSTSGTITGTYS